MCVGGCRSVFFSEMFFRLFACCALSLSRFLLSLSPVREPFRSGCCTSRFLFPLSRFCFFFLLLFFSCALCSALLYCVEGWWSPTRELSPLRAVSFAAYACPHRPSLSSPAFRRCGVRALAIVRAHRAFGPIRRPSADASSLPSDPIPICFFFRWAHGPGSLLREPTTRVNPPPPMIFPSCTPLCLRCPYLPASSL